MAKAKKVTTIEAVKHVDESGVLISKQRVCAYCRVSSNHLEQQKSFVSQVQFYTAFISENEQWIYSGIYADEGISGKSKQNRTEFLRMLADARNHCFDLVITKSISRFARNTTDCLEAVRELKALGIGIIFERENINTLSADSELLLTILSSIAIEELQSLSQNIRWSKQKQAKEGKVQVVTEWFMGYDRGENGELVINEEQAKIVRYIFDLYISGLGVMFRRLVDKIVVQSMVEVVFTFKSGDELREILG